TGFFLDEMRQFVNITHMFGNRHDRVFFTFRDTRFVQIHLEMEDSLPLVQAHMVADQVEQAILRRFPGS
ncbi:cation transporter dimerization domain-containing protein, partial [Escherichia coli]|uniref:cation transporter dimerization domain-containing protein n=1 Tax=Escherichia coli TaxID=562 RepID=UPI003EDF9639